MGTFRNVEFLKYCSALLGQLCVPHFEEEYASTRDGLAEPLLS
jgi:hypothetical protein